MNAILSRRHFQTGRLLLILGACAVYALLFVMTTQQFSSHVNHAAVLPALAWIQFGFSSFVALLFLAVGALVWLSARARREALLLFCFCAAMMASFCVQSAAKDNVPLFSAIGALSSINGLFPFTVLLLLFPNNFLARRKPTTHHDEQSKSSSSWWSTLVPSFLRGYIVVLCLFALGANACVLFQFVEKTPPPVFLRLCYSCYYVIAVLGILLLSGISYARTQTLRSRQQLRLFLISSIVALAPCFTLTILPVALNLPSQYVVDSQVSTLSVILLPLGFGYALLRYDLLVNDASIRFVVATVAGCVGLAVLTYVVIILSGLVLHTATSTMSIIWPTLIMAFVGPVMWRAMQRVSDRLFFPEVSHYRQLLEHPALLIRETLDLAETSKLLSVAMTQALEATSVCFFVLNEAGDYLLAPVFENTQASLDPRQALVRSVLDRVPLATTDGHAIWVPSSSELVARLKHSPRPLFFEEACQESPGSSLGLTRHFTDGRTDGTRRALLAPIWAKGEMIGLVMLDERGDGQPYAGPDFEAVSVILARYSSDLDNARLLLDLRLAYERQKELDRLKDELMINVSHELRTPLTQVSGYIDLLSSFEGTIEPAMQTTFLEKASHGCLELKILVDTILDAARSSDVSAPPHLEEVSVTEIIREELDNLDPQAAGEHRIVLHLADDLLVQADTQHVRQVLRNLLSNALKYSPKGTSISVTTEEREAPSGGFPLVSIRVKDQGLGIPPEEIPRLFGRFVRLNRDLSGSIRGTGMGLYISKQLIEAMGGTIWVESTGVPGEGSCFCFTLRRASKQQAVRVTTASDKNASGSIPSTPTLAR